MRFVSEDNAGNSRREFQIFLTFPKMLPVTLEGDFKDFRREFQVVQTEIRNVPDLDYNMPHLNKRHSNIE